MPQINKPSSYFNTVLYTANNGTLNVTGVGFQPDWVWIKDRDSNTHHNVYDIVRGVQKDLLTSSTNAETSSGELTSFDSDGFTVVDSATDRANYLTNNYASWSWLAGGTASSNTDGSITSSVSANTTSGFSIVSYTGTGSSDTVGHGLGVTPDMIILKNRSSSSGAWNVWHKDLTSGYNLGLHATVAQSDTSVFTQGIILDTTITSSVFGFTLAGSNYNVNSSSDNFIAYCFAEKKGFSKFGSYTGNGNADGTFIYTGMRPAMVICKASSTDGDWKMFDSKRIGYNAANYRLQPNSSAAETSDNLIDFLSNGFKLRTSSDSINGSGNTVIYMAFSENALVGTNNVVGCAR